MKDLKRTKIVCTIGPSCHDVEKLKKMLAAGMNVARFNFSHGDHKEKKDQMDVVKEAVKQSGLVAMAIPTTLSFCKKGSKHCFNFDIGP